MLTEERFTRILSILESMGSVTVQQLMTELDLSLIHIFGINATIAYFLGAQKQNTADKAASLGTLFNMIHGLILSLIHI